MRELLDRTPVIDVVQVEFVTQNGTVTSSSEYDNEMIGHGASLYEWVFDVVHERRRVLWLDLKENMNMVVGFCGEPMPLDLEVCLSRLDVIRQTFLDVECFVDEASSMSEIELEPPLATVTIPQTRQLKRQIDILPYILIGSGCRETLEQLRLLIDQRYEKDQRWHLLVDLPFIDDYSTVGSLLPCVRRGQDLSSYDVYPVMALSNWFALDCAFFKSEGDVVAFLLKLKLLPGSHVILYCFSLAYQKSRRPFLLDNHHLLFQYSY